MRSAAVLRSGRRRRFHVRPATMSITKRTSLSRLREGQRRINFSKRLTDKNYSEFFPADLWSSYETLES